MAIIFDPYVNTTNREDDPDGEISQELYGTSDDKVDDEED